MKSYGHRIQISLLALILASSWNISSEATTAAPAAVGVHNQQEKQLMSDNTRMIELFDRWERVWHQGEYDLIPSCVGDEYIRHDEKGDRTVGRDAYAAEIAQARKERPNTRFVIYDHTFEGNRAWFRFTLKWNDAATGEPRTRAGVQIYRVAQGKLVETWLMFEKPGSAWSDKVAQEHWTSPSPLQ